MPDIPTTEPTRITAGDTVRWHKSISGYAPPDWALEYQFASAQGVKTVTATASEDGLGYTVHITATESAGWPAGSYSWRARVRKDDDVYTMGEGLCNVLPAFSQPIDARSPARRALDAIKEYLANPQSIAVSGYSIRGRTLTQYSLPELWQHHDRLVQEVAREDVLRGAKGPGGRILVGFRR